MIKEAIKPTIEGKLEFSPPYELLELEGKKIKNSFDQQKTLNFGVQAKWQPSW